MKVTPVTIDVNGVERSLRFTQGAHRRIYERFQMGIKEALNKYDTGAFPGILYALMYDAKGLPPADLTEDELAEMLPVDGAAETLAAILSAAGQGKTPKNELETHIRESMRSQIGLENGVSQPNVLEFPTNNSGTDISSQKSLFGPNDTESSSDSGIIASAS